MEQARAQELQRKLEVRAAEEVFFFFSFFGVAVVEDGGQKRLQVHILVPLI